MNIFNDVQLLSCTNYSLPFLRHSRNDSDILKYIIPYFQKANYSVEYNLSNDEFGKLNFLSLCIN